MMQMCDDDMTRLIDTQYHKVVAKYVSMQRDQRDMLEKSIDSRINLPRDMLLVDKLKESG